MKNNFHKKIKGPVRVLVLSGYGINCEEETKFAFEKVGGKVDIVHINDLIASPEMFERYNILAFPGGFSYGDDTGSGKAFANKMKNHLSAELQKFVERDTLVIGICNGFQIITNLGLVEGGLSHNQGGVYIDRWVDLKVTGKSPWLVGIKKMSVPIAHGEGKFIIPKKEFLRLKKTEGVLFYENGEICKFQQLKPNPNGSMFDVAGVTSHSGRVLGLMPHPERAIFSHHSPKYQYDKELATRKNKKVPEFSENLKIFQNAVNYFKK